MQIAVNTQVTYANYYKLLKLQLKQTLIFGCNKNTTKILQSFVYKGFYKALHKALHKTLHEILQKALYKALHETLHKALHKTLHKTLPSGKKISAHCCSRKLGSAKLTT